MDQSVIEAHDHLKLFYMENEIVKVRMLFTFPITRVEEVMEFTTYGEYPYKELNEKEVMDIRGNWVDVELTPDEVGKPIQDDEFYTFEYKGVLFDTGGEFLQQKMNVIL